MFTGPPTVTTTPRDKLIAVNSSIKLTCKANGYGIIKYQWHKRKYSHKWMMISDNNDNVYVTERLQESIEFRCTASNKAGRSKSRSTVTVLSKKQ